MIYAYDQALQLPTVDLYDTQMMAMAVNAAKDMYNRGQESVKEFYKTYGDFMSPFAKDMERYGQMMGNVRNLINDAYARGIDLARSPEGRALIQRAVYSVNPGEFNRMRTNAKVGFEYLSEIEKARAKGEFDQDYEDFLLRQAGLGPFDQFSSKMGMWNRPGPGVYQDVNKWTHHLFDNMELSYDPELSKKYPGFMAYTKSRDTMNQIVDNNIAGLLNTDLGKYRLQQLKNAGLSDEQAVAALKKMVVDSNYEENKVQLQQDPYAIMQQQFNNSLALQRNSQEFQREMAEQAAKDKLDQIQARYGFKTGDGRSSSNNYSLTEELHHDLLYQGLLNSGMPIPETEIDKKGNRVVKYDKNGKMLTKPISQATFDDLEFAANYQNRYGVMQQDYAANLTSVDKYDAKKAWNKFRQRYGSSITNIQLAAMLKKQPQSDGGFLLSIDQAKLLRGVNGIMSDIRGSKKKMTYSERVSEVLPKDVINALNGDDNSSVQIKFTLNDSGNNATQVFEKYNRGRTDIYASGTVTYTWETGSGTEKKKYVRTVENVQLPLGINSEINAKNTTNTSLAGAKRSAYSSIDANYLKQLGQQQKTNIGLFANTPAIPSMIDPSTMTMEEWAEFIQNNQE